ncbi:MAG: acyl carrier protein [Bacteroidales bacterium]|nr:acyl carrier protein [Bacteroidales bacterium]
MEQLIYNLKEQIIERLNLTDTKPADVDSDAPLFDEGLGLDSIDALEIIVLLQQVYGIKITNAEEGKKAMRSVKTLAEYIIEKKG